MEEELWLLYHENTKYSFDEEFKVSKREFPKKIFYKQYLRCKKVKLIENFEENEIVKVIRKRRSVREFANKPITLEELSKILILSAGITRKSKNWDECFRAYPSAGARYPLEIYPVILNARGIEKGLYHYNVKYNLLERLAKGDFREKIVYLCNTQEWVKDASIVLFITAVFLRTIMKYGERGYRYVLLDCGHMAQNIYLVATSLGLGACAIGGFRDEEVNEFIGIDGKHESVIYVIAIGKPFNF